MTTEDRPTTSFVIRFVGNDIRPWKVPVLALTRTLEAVNLLVIGDDETDDNSREVHLLDVTSGSASYQIGIENSERALIHLRLAHDVIDDPEKAETTDFVVNPIEKLSAIAKQLECEIEFRLPGKNGDVIAKIVPTTYQSIAKNVFVRGETTIEARIERIGGATRMSCALRVRGYHRLIFCDVESTAVAREMGQHLYQHAIFCGTATWYRRNWRIRRFYVKGMNQVRRTSVLDKFKALRSAVGDSWDHLDPNRVIADLRGND